MSKHEPRPNWSDTFQICPPKGLKTVDEIFDWSATTAKNERMRTETVSTKQAILEGQLLLVAEEELLKITGQKWGVYGDKVAKHFLYDMRTAQRYRRLAVCISPNSPHVCLGQNRILRIIGLFKKKELNDAIIHKFLETHTILIPEEVNDPNTLKKLKQEIDAAIELTIENKTGSDPKVGTQTNKTKQISGLMQKFLAYSEKIHERLRSFAPELRAGLDGGIKTSIIHSFRDIRSIIDGCEKLLTDDQYRSVEPISFIEDHRI